MLDKYRVQITLRMTNYTLDTACMDDLTPKQASAIIGMSTAWLYEKIREGNGPAHKRRGYRIRISKESLLEWDKQEHIASIKRTPKEIPYEA